MVCLTVCAVQVSETKDIGGATLSVAVCARADGDLTGGYISRGSCDDGAADEGCDDGCGKHFEMGEMDVMCLKDEMKGQMKDQMEDVCMIPSRVFGREACSFIPIFISCST